MSPPPPAANAGVKRDPGLSIDQCRTRYLSLHWGESLGAFMTAS
jgi:hypothetical protein